MPRRLKLDEPLRELITNSRPVERVTLLTKVQVTCDRFGVEFDDKYPVSPALLPQIHAYVRHNAAFFNAIYDVLQAHFPAAYTVMEMHPLYAFVGLRDRGLELVLQFKSKGARLIFQSQPFELPNKAHLDALLDARDYLRFFDTLARHAPLLEFVHLFDRGLLDCALIADAARAVRNVYFVPLDAHRFSISFHLRFYEDQRAKAPGHAIVSVFAVPGARKLFFATAYDNVAAFDLFHAECKARFPSLAFARDSLSLQYAGGEELREFFPLFLSLVYAYLALLQGFRYVG